MTDQKLPQILLGTHSSYVTLTAENVEHWSPARPSEYVAPAPGSDVAEAAKRVSEALDLFPQVDGPWGSGKGLDITVVTPDGNTAHMTDADLRTLIAAVSA